MPPHRRAYLLLIALSGGLLGCPSASPNLEPVPPLEATTASIMGKYTPPLGTTLLIIGQDLTSIADYKDAVQLPPGGATTYTNISEGEAFLNGLTTRADWGAGPIHAQQNLTDDPHAVLSIGLYLVDTTGSSLQHLAEGAHDAAIDDLGAFIQQAERPVFLRIGYEFDGAWNHYEPNLYVAAFRHLTDRLRAQGTTNFATVWQSATYAGGTYNNHPVEAWYPGDAYVDWFGTSYFVFDPSVHDAFLDLARAHDKPVLIAEATPQGYDLEALTYRDPTGEEEYVPKTPDAIWEEWFAPFFGYIHDNADVIRAVAYINADWNSQPMWAPDGGNGYWGDARVQANPKIQEKWLAEINTDFWLHGVPDLFDTLGYE